MLYLFKHAGECLAIVFVAGMYTVTENNAVNIAGRLHTICEYILVLAFAEPAAFRVAGALLAVLFLLLPCPFLFGGVWIQRSLAAVLRRLGVFLVLLLVFQRFLSVSFPIPVNFLP